MGTGAGDSGDEGRGSCWFSGLSVELLKAVLQGLDLVGLVSEVEGQAQGHVAELVDIHGGTPPGSGVLQVLDEGAEGKTGHVRH
jgi:hypothetical protein